MRNMQRPMNVPSPATASGGTELNRQPSRPMNVPSPATASGGTQLNLHQPSRPLQPPLQRRLSASSTNNNVVAERGVTERQISNRSVVDIHRRSTDPPANTSTTVPLSSTQRASRRVSDDGNGVSMLVRQSSISSKKKWSKTGKMK